MSQVGIQMEVRWQDGKEGGTAEGSERDSNAGRRGSNFDSRARAFFAFFSPFFRLFSPFFRLFMLFMLWLETRLANQIATAEHHHQGHGLSSRSVFGWLATRADRARRETAPLGLSQTASSVSPCPMEGFTRLQRRA